MSKVCGIYKITSPSGKVYIGQSFDIKRRFTSYKTLNKSKRQAKLYNSFVKYGVDNHIFEIIEECLVDFLNERERYWQEQYNVLESIKGLNLCLTSTKDKKHLHSEETRTKISESNKGEKCFWYGKTFSEETKSKMRESRKGYKHTQESLDKMSLSQKGRTREDMIGDNNPSKNIEIREKLKGSNNHNSKKVTNIITNEVFDCAREAWENYHKEQYCYNYFMEMLRNKKPNKTNFKYL
jgi:group I intron endonuclease